MTELPGRLGVLVGFDGSAGSRRALGWAAAVADRAKGAVHVMTAVPSRPFVHGRHAQVTEHARVAVEEAAAEVRARHPGLPVATAVHDGPPGDVLTESTAAADIVVVGRRGHGEILDALLGSVSMRVCAHATCPAVVVPPGAETVSPFGAVVVGVGDVEDRVAVDFAVSFATRTEARVVALNAWSLPVSGFAPELAVSMLGEVPDISAGQERMLADVAAAVRERRPDALVEHVVVEGSPGHRLVAAVAADDAEVPAPPGHVADAGLLVVAAHRRRGPFPLRIGPTVHSVLHHSRCPVAVVPAPKSHAD